MTFSPISKRNQAQKLLGQLEIVPGCPMVATITYPAYSEPFPPTFQPIFHPKMTFSPILKRNQALVQLSSY